MWSTLYGAKELKKKKKKAPQPGDWVHITKRMSTFKKGYLPNWTEELFSAVRKVDINPPLYILQDYLGDIIKGGFYEEEIKKVDKVDCIYLVEEIVNERTKKGGGQEVEVKWLGYLKKFNKWIDKNIVEDYKKRRNL